MIAPEAPTLKASIVRLEVQNGPVIQDEPVELSRSLPRQRCPEFDIQLNQLLESVNVTAFTEGPLNSVGRLLNGVHAR